MRKRIVIGLLAIVVIGVVAFFLSQPKRGSVEWHKKEYLAAKKGTLTERAREAIWMEVMTYTPARIDQIRKHEQTLIDLGYLERREFVVSNRPREHVAREARLLLRNDPRWSRAERDFINTAVRGSNVLVTVATREDMPIFAEAIRRADVAEPEK